MSLRRIGGLAAAVAGLTGVRASTLVSRTAWDDALGKVRERHAGDGRGPARLSVASVPSAALRRDMTRAARLVRDFPAVLAMEPSELDAVKDHELSVALAGNAPEPPPGTLSRVISFLQLHRVARSAGRSRADLRDAELLTSQYLGSRRAKPPVDGARRPAHPSWRPSARYALLDPSRDAVALAHAVGAMASADVEVSVREGNKTLVRRGARETGVRCLDGFAWHGDPGTAAGMEAAARDWCLRHAAWRVEAPGDADWAQAVVHRRDAGHAAFVLWRDGRVTYHRVETGSAAPGDHAGAVAEAVAAGPADPSPRDAVADMPSEYCTDRPVGEDGRDRLDVCEGLAAAVAHLPRGRRASFGHRVDAMATRGSRAAVIRFEEACPSDLRRVAGHVMDVEDPVRGDGSPHGLRTFRLSRRLRALAVASTHADVSAVAQAADRVPALVAVARCDEGWGPASAVLAGGGRDAEALARFASEVAGWPANRNVARLLRGMPRSPDRPRAYVDVVKVAVAVAVAAPSRPAMDLVTASDAVEALRTLGVAFDPLDPVTAAAVVGALSDGHGPATLSARALSVADVWNAFHRCAGRCGIEPGHVGALRDEALLPRGRNLAGLSRISAAWHARVQREGRERRDLLGLLRLEERRSMLAGPAGSREPWAFPAPFTAPVTLGGVEVVPLRDDDAFVAESEAQSSCVASYVGEARRGRLVVHSLRSAEGRSTAGHWVDVAGGEVTFRLFQHEADQASFDSTPPAAHVRAVEAMLRSLAGKGRDGVGERGWRARMAEARRVHDVMGADIESEALTGDRRDRLLASDMAHLGRMLGRREAALDAPGLRAHARSLAEARGVELVRLRVRTDST